MRFLVTGASGFIGSNLALELQKHGEVVGLCSMNPGYQQNLKDFKGKFVQADIRGFDYSSLGEFDAIFHQAAVTDTTVTDRRLMFTTNVNAFIELLDYAVAINCHKVVYASSAATYGKGKVPMMETDPSKPANLYASSKVEMEMVGREYQKKFREMSIVGLRYFNVYGPREFHKNKAASMVYQLYQQISKRERPRIFKWGEQSRDFIYVKDVVLANLKAYEFKDGGVFNVGTGIATSFNRVIEVLNQALGAVQPTDYFDNPYDFYQDQTQADTLRAEQVLKFKCQYSPEQGIRDYVEWLKKNKQMIHE
jgi:ADP-L-glycero-D-manno-heptose 6-epimerase